MSQVAFDTLEYAQALRDAGVPQKEAEAFARANASALRQMLGQQELATRADLEIGLAKTKEELRAEIQRSHNSMIAWLIGPLAAFASILVAVMAWLIRLN